MPVVRSVCLFHIFLLLFSNKMKSSFLFYRGTKQFKTTHTAKYRISDVIMIYRIVHLIYLFKNFVSIVMNLSISLPQKTADNT